MLDMEYVGKAIFDFSIEGEIVNVDDIQKSIGKCKNKIVVLKDATPDIILLYREIKGVICERGGITCHLSILSREMSIPCVVGVKDATHIKNGTYIRIRVIDGVGYINEI